MTLQFLGPARESWNQKVRLLACLKSVCAGLDNDNGVGPRQHGHLTIPLTFQDDSVIVRNDMEQRSSELVLGFNFTAETTLFTN